MPIFNRKIATRHDRDDARQDEEPAAHDAAERPVHQPADIGRELLRLRPGKEHAVIERMQKPVLGNPALLLDEDLVHYRDLAGWAAEAQQGDTQPDAKCFRQRHAVRGRSAVTEAGKSLVHVPLLTLPGASPAASCGSLSCASTPRRKARRRW